MSGVVLMHSARGPYVRRFSDSDGALAWLTGWFGKGGAVAWAELDPETNVFVWCVE